MSRQFLLLLLILCGAVAPAVRADEPVARSTPASTSPSSVDAPQEGLLLMRNGQVMRGKITPAGDDYFVTLPSGEIRVRKEQVELLAADLETCYTHKLTTIDLAKVSDRQDLAQWCILQELFDDATKELAEAAALDNKNPRTALIERQLKLARERPARAEAARIAREHLPSNEDLDRLVRGMPPGSVETFSSTIQPLLLNTCATSGCHGPQSKCELKLVRVQVGKGANRRLTQRNLHSVLQMIDRADPPGSRLLTAPIGPHGETGAPIFTSKQAVQYRQLVNWVSRVAQSAETPLPTSVAPPDDKLLQRVAVRQWPEMTPPTASPSTTPTTFQTPKDGAQDTAPHLPPSAPLETPRATGPRSTDPALAPPTLPAKSRPGKPAAMAPPAIDPFDPAAFNRNVPPTAKH